MNTPLNLEPVRLRSGGLLRVHEGRGRRLSVLAGHAWITQDGDPRDVVLRVGESFLLDRPGLAIVQALDDACILLSARPTGATALRGASPASGAAR